MKQQFAAKHPWAILAAGAAIQILTGLPAAWGVFQQPVMDEFSLTEDGAGYAFGILIAAFGVGCVIGGFLQDKKGPRCAALWGTGLLCGGFFAAALLPGGKGGSLVLGSVQHSGGAGHGVSLPVHPVLRPEMVRRAQGPCHRGHWRRGGPERCVPDRIRPHGAEGLWPGAGNPGGVLGAGGTHAAGLPCGQRPAHRPASGKAEARGAGQGKRHPVPRPCPAGRCSEQNNTGSVPGRSAFPPRRCCCSAPSS